MEKDSRQQGKAAGTRRLADIWIKIRMYEEEEEEEEEEDDDDDEMAAAAMYNQLIN
uniref:Uncharacterized protein n=1 Tax=Cucumis melo TaxID=3656 RepID=A0A9I9D2Q1_CUCME